MFAQNATKTLFVSVLTVVFFLGAFLSVAHMKMDINGQMTDCPAVPGVAICNMTPQQHIAAAQIMLTALAQSSDFLSMMLLLMLGLLIIATHNYHRRTGTFSPTPEPRRSRVEVPVVISALQIAFARGILNPKVF